MKAAERTRRLPPRELQQQAEHGTLDLKDFRFLADTQVLIWYAAESTYLTARIRKLLALETARFYFSLESIREIAIKYALGRPDFRYAASAVYQFLVESNWQELTVTAEHIFELQTLPLLHRDPFDRMLVAQARVERLTLVTADAQLERYAVNVFAA